MRCLEETQRVMNKSIEVSRRGGNILYTEEEQETCRMSLSHRKGCSENGTVSHYSSVDSSDGDERGRIVVAPKLASCYFEEDERWSEPPKIGENRWCHVFCQTSLCAEALPVQTATTALACSSPFRTVFKNTKENIPATSAFVLLASIAG